MDRSVADWSPARLFLAASAAYHLVLGGVGLVVDRSFPLSSGDVNAGSDLIFGIFETNGWHSVAGVFIGLISLWFAIRPARARDAALAVGISQAFVVLAFTFRDPSQFLFASNAADQVIHTVTAVGGIVSALMTGREPQARVQTAPEA